MSTTWRKFSIFIFVFMLHVQALAHVKWFSDFNFADRPLTLQDAITPTVTGLAALSMFVLAALVIIDRRLETMGWYQRFNGWFDARRQYSTLVMRIGLGATLLMAWQNDSLFVPRLPIEQGWVGWVQFVLIFLLFFERTTPFAGWGTAFLYVIGILNFGWFYMLDYALFLGVAYYLIFQDHPSKRISGTTLPALYVTVGISLIWPGLEKIFYPQWGLYVLTENPALALGLPIDFFLVGAAFVELALGYLLLIGLLERPLALLVTLVFFTTTTFFGKVEIIGHTIIHAALIVFLLEGPGSVYKAPITFHQRTGLRMAFAAVNFLLIVGLSSVPYAWGAQQAFQHAADEALANANQTIAYETVMDDGRPTLGFDVSYTPETAWIIDINAPNFRYTRDEIPPDLSDGLAYIFQDGDLIGVTTTGIYQLRNIEPGTYDFTVSLHTPDGQLYTIDGDPLRLSRNITIESQTSVVDRTIR
jgi:uncharacterized membrane protein YphA (DoxX/SURF4 family)